MRGFRAVLILWLAIGFANLAQAQIIEDGEFGGRCPADTACLEGVCNVGLDLCVSCGMPGQMACEGPTGAPECSLPSWGNRPIALSDGRVICAQQVEDPLRACGHVGFAACEGAGAPFCRFGVLAPTTTGGVSGICEDCGGFGQPCCQDTGLACDFGTCQGGVCLPETGGAPDRIRALIEDCNFRDARVALAAMSATDPDRPALEAALAAATAREDQVRALYDDARSLARDAKALLEAGDEGNAGLTFHTARGLLQQARQTSACDRNQATLDEAIAMTDRNWDRITTSISLDYVRTVIGLCDFANAEQELAGLADDTEGHAALVEALRLARAREDRVYDLYGAAKKRHEEGQAAFRAGDYEGAVAAYSEARQGFVNARQLTECTGTRDIIDEAIQIVGRNLNAAQGLADTAPVPDPVPAEPDQPEVAQAPDIMPPGPHPCLDSSVAAEGWVSGYTLGLGGGHSLFAKKGPFICGFQGSFTLLYGGVMISYACDTTGGRYENCVAGRRAVISSEGAVHDGYVYRYDDGNHWIVVGTVK